MRAGAAPAAALAAALGFALAPAAPAQEGPFAARHPVDAARFVSLFVDICLDGLPAFERVGAALDAEGFGAPDAAGFRLHADRAVAAMAVTPAEAAPQAAPICMVMAPDVPFDAAEGVLAERLTARFGDLESAASGVLDLPHRVWILDDEEGAAEVVLTRDGQGHLGVLVALPPAGDGS